MSRPSRIRAWDELWDVTRHITRVQHPEERRTERHAELIDALDKLTRQPLSIEAINAVSWAVENAYIIGRDEATARAPADTPQ